MIAAVLKAADARSLLSRLDDVPRWAWWLLAVAVIAFRGWCVAGTGIYGNLGDADDATRLIQVREFMASGHWFDTTTMKIGGDAGMLSHWSRLIDLPLAVLIATFSLVTSTENAERLTHIVWPTALLAGVLWVVYRTTVKVAGDTAGRLALLLTVLSPFALYQFAVGRIDHHNVMIAATVSAVLLLWCYPRRTDVWRLAGVLTGIALAVGYEALAPAVAVGLLIALWGLVDRRAEDPAGAFALALALTFALAFFATIAPSRWLDIHCDAISLNMVLLIACGASGFAFAVGRGRDWPLTGRLAVVGATTAAGLILFGTLEPKCLAGPTGQLPPLLTKVWMQNVAEGNSIIADIFKGNLDQSLGLLAFFIIAVAAAARLARDSRSPADIFLLAALTAFAAFACWQYKFMSYASFLALAPIAIVISRLEGIGEISAPTIRFTALVLTSQAFLLAVSGLIDGALGTPKILTAAMHEDAQACSKPDAVRDLEGLQPGLVAAHLDIGAYIAALTPQRVLAAPYHRIADAIIANHNIFAATDPAEAATLLKREHVDYVVICRGVDAPYALNPAWKNSLRLNLVDGHAPKYLTPVALPNPHALLQVWKVDRPALSLQQLNLQPSAAGASAP